MHEHNRGNLLIIGGAEDKEGSCKILKTFLAQAEKRKGPVCICTAAADDQEKTGRLYQDAFTRLGCSDGVLLFIDNRAQAGLEENLHLVRQSSGLFFTGGDQLRLTTLLGGTPLEEVLQHLYEDGVIIGGTSAGASAMSDTMIIGGEGDTPGEAPLRMAPGLGFLSGVLVDQHFAQRGRIGRLLTAVAHHPRVLGLGLDEDTAVHCQGSFCRVLGRGTALVIDASEAALNNADRLSSACALTLAAVKIHVLGAGSRFDLRRRSSEFSGMRKE